MRKKRTLMALYKKIRKINEKRRKTDEEFQTAMEGIEDQDLNPEPPSNYQCLYGPEVWGSKGAFEFHMRLAHYKVDTFQLEDLPDEVLLNVFNFLELCTRPQSVWSSVKKIEVRQPDSIPLAKNCPFQ